MSKMPVDREEKQKDIFRRFGIPKLRNEETPKPELVTENDKAKNSEETKPQKRR